MSGLVYAFTNKKLVMPCPSDFNDGVTSKYDSKTAFYGTGDQYNNPDAYFPLSTINGLTGIVLSVELTQPSPMLVWCVDMFSPLTVSPREVTGYGYNDRERLYHCESLPESSWAHKFGYIRRSDYHRNGANDYSLLGSSNTELTPKSLRIIFTDLTPGTQIARIIWAGVKSGYAWLGRELFAMSWI